MQNGQQKAFEPAAAAVGVLRRAATGALATLTDAGHPFASFVTVATAGDGTPLLLLSRLAVHTRNLEGNPKASLLMIAPGGEGGDPLAGSRITVEGEALRLAPDDPRTAEARRRFLSRHPEAEGYAGFADFGFFRLEVAKVHLVAGFGRIHSLGQDEILVGKDLADAFREAEASIVSHMNEDHADAVRLYATRLLGLPDGAWSVVGADADGIDLRLGDLVARLPFRARQGSVGAVRFELKALSEAARGD